MSYDLIIPLTLFLIGFYVLVKGANLLIRGAVSVAKIFDVSAWFVGIVIVGIGTSIPEFSINLASVFVNGENVGLATIIGSNTFNILVILGISAIFYPIVVDPLWVKRDFIINIFSVTVAAILIFYPVFGPTDFVGISQGEGLLLLVLFLVWIVYMLNRRADIHEDDDVQTLTILTASGMIVIGIVGVFFGGRWVVDGAKVIATLIGISPAVVGLTIVAIGTSLPELTVSLTALFRRNRSIAVGNIIGSNIFDFLGILGITGSLKAISVLESVKFDIFAAFGAVLLLLIVMFTGKRYTLARFEGVLFILLYIIYITFLFLR